MSYRGWGQWGIGVSGVSGSVRYRGQGQWGIGVSVVSGSVWYRGQCGIRVSAYRGQWRIGV
ncbi:hypothetical protein chiPu_0032670, partial [Chiloscyllium punctatum]|nr:hypothetical protein [Chiloscyllium punctatum]